MKHIVTCDLDSTLADTRHRHQMIDRIAGTDWQAYAKACGADGVVIGAAALVRALAPTHEIHYVTGRPFSAYPETMEWLTRHHLPVDGLWMDPSDGVDYATAMDHATYKLGMIRRVERHTQRGVIFHLDDWALVRVVLEEHGIPCLCVRTPQEVAALTAQEVEA